MEGLPVQVLPGSTAADWERQAFSARLTWARGECLGGGDRGGSAARPDPPQPDHARVLFYDQAPPSRCNSISATDLKMVEFVETIATTEGQVMTREPVIPPAPPRRPLQEGQTPKPAGTSKPPPPPPPPPPAASVMSTTLTSGSCARHCERIGRPPAPRRNGDRIGKRLTPIESAQAASSAPAQVTRSATGRPRRRPWRRFRATRPRVEFRPPKGGHLRQGKLHFLRVEPRATALRGVCRSMGGIPSRSGARGRIGLNGRQ